MDGTDESYLTLLNDGTHNYLLQTSEESLVQDPSLNVEPMFTEIEDGTGAWSVGLPILMNGSLISEADQQLEPSIDLTETQSNNHESNLTTNMPELYRETLQNQEESILPEVVRSENQLNYPIEIPGKGFITTDGLFITNDLLFQFKFNLDNENPESTNMNLSTNTKTNEQNILINPKTLAPNNGNFVSETQERSLKNGDVIHLLNTDGAQINIDKLLGTAEAKNQPILHKSNGKAESVLEGKCFDIVMAHKCKQCSYLCEEKNEMLAHWQTNHLAQENDVKTVVNGEIKMKSILKPQSDAETVYVCSVCSLGFGSTIKLKNHMMNVHKLIHQIDIDVVYGKSVVTVKDEKSTKLLQGKKSKLSLTEIQKQARASKKMKCSIKGCDLRFSMDDMRLRHEKCHVDGEKKQFRCFECGIKFSIWRICSLHLWKCHKVDLGLFTCPMCSVFKASSAGRLLTHMATHNTEKPFLCNVCGKNFKQHTELRNHQVLVHKEVNDVPEWTAQQQCETCKKFFANSKSLKKHIQSVHDKFKPFICNVCGHKTTRKSMLDLHLRQHTGEKPHQCPVCEYKTGDHNSLRRHVMRHSGDTKYACPHCSYQSIQSTSYKNHIASKHPGLGGSYFCTLCSYHTVNENTYNNHLADHKNGLIKENADSNDSIQKNSLNETQTSVNLQNQKDQAEEDDTQNYLLMLEHSNDAIGIDTGGITIPAGLELATL
ncbi:hypothetical protein RN001_009100 [Aquatica leii]|uniref:C2H2-type domain-containing protein n=1 Tax=Aquatica leii TaxID=1421715 RepID=A0AAN7P436_9COLE|nr:hypothetical protein RN001_009100 [Aquatica leii]